MGAKLCAVLILAVAWPMLARAQFQAPTDEELKMASEPKAPGEAAIYLNREENADNTLHSSTYYARIKVFTEKGESLATIRIPYIPGSSIVKKIEGRTIHSDGTVTSMTVKPEDLTDFKSKYYQENSVVFTLPSVEVGSILEYRVVVQYFYGLLQPTWEIQQAYFVRKAHFGFQPGLGLTAGYVDGRGQNLDRLMWVASPQNLPIQHQKDGRITLDMSDIASAPNEDWMPPLNTISKRVEFYYTYAKSADQFWNTEHKFWAKDTEDFTKQTGTIKKAAEGIVSPSDSDDVKARKIYAAVMKIDNTDYSRVKSEAERKKDKLKEIKRAEDVWKDQSGPGNSIALLYVALARAAGLKAYPMQVVDRNLAFFDISYFSVRQLDDYIAVVQIDGKDIFVDPGTRMCPFGSLHWAHGLAGGFRLTDNGVVVADTPGTPPIGNVTQHLADLTIDAQGHVSGTARYVMTGSEALYWRQKSLENDENELRKMFIESLRSDLPNGIEVDFDHFLDLDDFESPLMAIVKVSGTMGTFTGKRMILPGLFFESVASHPFVAEAKRITPIDVHYASMEQDRVTYRLPPGFTIESTPKSTDVTWARYAQLRINSTPEADTVEVARAFARGFIILGPESYNDLHDFYLKLAAADQQEIVLMRPEAAKGN